MGLVTNVSIHQELASRLQDLPLATTGDSATQPRQLEGMGGSRTAASPKAQLGLGIHRFFKPRPGLHETFRVKDQVLRFDIPGDAQRTRSRKWHIKSCFWSDMACV